MKMGELKHLQEEKAVDITGLYIYRTKLKAIESRVDVKSVALAHHEASSDEATTKLQHILLAVLAKEKKLTE